MTDPSPALRPDWDLLNLLALRFEQAEEEIQSYCGAWEGLSFFARAYHWALFLDFVGCTDACNYVGNRRDVRGRFCALLTMTEPMSLTPIHGYYVDFEVPPPPNNCSGARYAHIPRLPATIEAERRLDP